jgi:hypothetical protein
MACAKTSMSRPGIAFHVEGLLHEADADEVLIPLLPACRQNSRSPLP